jgi:CDP-paratose synthetase
LDKSVKTILISGGTGFLGSHLADVLVSNGYSVVILKRSSSDLWRIDHFMSSLKSYDIDLVPIESAFIENKIDCVIHTACHYGRNNDPIEEIINTNLVFGLQILDLALKNKVQIFMNSDTLLPKNLNSYALSKNQFVDWLKHFSKNIKVINLKIEHMFGPKDDAKKLVPWIISEFEAQVSIIALTAGQQKRDFIYIDDVVSAFVLLLEKVSILSGFSQYEVGTGMSVTVKSFLSTLKEVYEENKKEVATKLAFGAVPTREGEIMNVEVDNSDLMNLGWKPCVSLEQGLNNLMREYL